MATLSPYLSDSDDIKRELKILSTALEFEYRRASRDFRLNSPDVADARALCSVLSTLSNSQSMIFRLLSSETDRNTVEQALNKLQLDLELESAEQWSNKFYRASEGTVRILQCVQATQARII
jgi:hypothetical protein